MDHIQKIFISRFMRFVCCTIAGVGAKHKRLEFHWYKKSRRKVNHLVIT